MALDTGPNLTGDLSSQQYPAPIYRPQKIHSVLGAGRRQEEDQGLEDSCACYRHSNMFHVLAATWRLLTIRHMADTVMSGYGSDAQLQHPRQD